MTDPTTADRHTCHNQKAAAGPAWQCPRCSLPPAHQTTLRDRIAEAALAAVEAALGDTLVPAARAEALAGVVAVLPAPADRAAVIREIADEIAGIDFHPNARARSLDIAAGLARRLRRVADETATTETQAALVYVGGCTCAPGPEGQHEGHCGYVPDDTTVADTLPAWLNQRFDPRGPDWEQLDEDDRMYWEHQARAVRRAVARGGFKQPAAGAQQDGADRG
ncbi:hypothetical protein [Streptomyces rochei]|uniref:hypothetical protein n=1 Tax=Streptomyces rochei TaxID=1928 RepID=UPI0040628AD8